MGLYGRPVMGRLTTLDHRYTGRILTTLTPPSYNGIFFGYAYRTTMDEPGKTLRCIVGEACPRPLCLPHPHGVATNLSACPTLPRIAQRGLSHQ
jgi:hypothetical protein